MHTIDTKNMKNSLIFFIIRDSIFCFVAKSLENLQSLKSYIRVINVLKIKSISDASEGG